MGDMDDIYVIKWKRIRIHLKVYLQVNAYMVTQGHTAHIQSLHQAVGFLKRFPFSGKRKD